MEHRLEIDCGRRTPSSTWPTGETDRPRAIRCCLRSSILSNPPPSTPKKKDPIKLVDAPSTCKTVYHPPRELDASTMAVLDVPPISTNCRPTSRKPDRSSPTTSRYPVHEAGEPGCGPARNRRPRLAGARGIDPFRDARPNSSGPHFGGRSHRCSPGWPSIRRSLPRPHRGPVGVKQHAAGGWLLVGQSGLWRLFHAVGPGHGKAVITSYLMARATRRGAASAFLLSALVQAQSAIAIVAIGTIVSRVTATTMTAATDTIEIASYAEIAVFGAWMPDEAARWSSSPSPPPRRSGCAPRHGDDDHGHHQDHDPPHRH